MFDLVPSCQVSRFQRPRWRLRTPLLTLPVTSRWALQSRSPQLRLSRVFCRREWMRMTDGRVFVMFRWMMRRSTSLDSWLSLACIHWAISAHRQLAVDTTDGQYYFISRLQASTSAAANWPRVSNSSCRRQTSKSSLPMKKKNSWKV